MFINFLNQNIYKASKINNIKSNINSIQKNIAFGTKYDTFEKTHIEGANKVASSNLNIWDEDRIKEIYNKTYNDVMAQIPLTDELKIEQPKIAFDETENGNMTELAGYVFSSNTMSFSPEICGDFFLCTVKDDEGNLKGNFGIHSEKESQQYYKAAREYGYHMEPVKLNNKEKEALIQTMIAHELRHCVQTHLIASTRGCSMPFKALLTRIFENKALAYKKAYAQLEELNRKLEAMGLPPEKTDIEPPDYSIIEYSDNYVPKKPITDDTKLKFSLSPKDSRYLSTKEHLLAYTKDAASNLSVPLYQASPMEMDANNFAYEYYSTRIKNKPGYNEMRPVIVDAIQVYFFDKAKTGITSMKNFGYPPLIKK